MSRQIVLDTETTGFDHKTGDRIVEIGCIEMIDRQITDNHFHIYINPERDMPVGAFEVHGLSEEFLSDKPVFSEIAQSFLDYVNSAELIIHNARFDIGFLNFELKKIGFSAIDQQSNVIDTLVMARNIYPGQRNTLDALCRRLNVDNTNRTLHGALIDAELLAQVYLNMTGGQEALFFNEEMQSKTENALNAEPNLTIGPINSSKRRLIFASESELTEHERFVKEKLT